MRNNVFLKKNLIYLLVIAGIIILSVLYCKYISRTKIGIINFPEYMYVKMAKSNDSRFVRLDYLKPDTLPDLTDYDMLLIWGHGLKMTAQIEKMLSEARGKGVNIMLHNFSNPGVQLTTLEGRDYDMVFDYIDHAGTYNYKNLFRYIRRNIDKKFFFTQAFDLPKKYASEIFFHIDEDAIFDKLTNFEKYCLKKGFHKPGARKVALFTSVPGPFNANRDHLNSIITEIQSRGYNVYPVSGMTGRIEILRKIAPSLVIYMPHGRLSMGDDAPTLEALRQLNVPVICPLSIHEKYDDWIKDKMGMFGGMLGQSITMPELDGGIIPYATVAEYEDENGYLVFRAIPDRLKGLGEIISNYIHLQETANRNKKVAIVYYKGHGKNALEAAGMEVLPSLFNLLKKLKGEGYQLDGLPDNFNEFASEVMKKGPVFGPYARGAFDKYLKNGNPEMIPVNQYVTWCTNLLPRKLYEDVETRYGKAPGQYMAVSKDSADYIAVSRVRFGNIVLLPQPLPGLGDNTFELVHGAKVAPPHSYIAPYAWIRKSFKADAIIHFGTHGSLEFTPGKQVALSNNDWADPLIGTIPHFYVYTISDPGEAMIAKHRSYATVFSHLTPPFIESLLLDNKKIIRDKLAKYESATGVLKNEYAAVIRKLAEEEGYLKDLNIKISPESSLPEKQMMQLTNYLDELDNEKVTAGLYTLGNAYSPDKIISTVVLISSDALAYSLANMDRIRGRVSMAEMENKAYFNFRYLQPAKGYVKTILNHGNSNLMLKKLITAQDLERALKWKKYSSIGNPELNHEVLKIRKSEKAIEWKKIEHWVAKILSDPESKALLLKFKSDKEFEKVFALLDPDKLDKARSIAKMIPAMQKSIQVAQDSIMMSLVSVMREKSIREKVLQWAEDPKFAQKIAIEKIKLDSLLVIKALNDNNLVLLNTDFNSAGIYTLEKYAAGMEFYKLSKEKLQTLLPAFKTALTDKLLRWFSQGEFDRKYALFNNYLTSKEKYENEFAETVLSIKSALEQISHYRADLEGSPEGELKSIVKGLNGGYLLPSPGGDPITNPLTLPTGRNLVSVNAEVTPTREAWNVAKRLGDAMLADYIGKHGRLPKKVSYSLWSSEFIETEGATIAQVLYMLGVEPVWDVFGRVQDLRLIPAKELSRPRIDVVVQTSGQLRDLAASRLFLINRAIVLAASDKSITENFVSEGSVLTKKRLLEKGYSPNMAERLSNSRVFGGVNGEYGTNISGMVESGDTWDSTSTIARTYINNMNAIYGSQDTWGDNNQGLFEAALQNTEVVVQPRQSNTWGALSLDHVYEFMGGLNLAIRQVTGIDAESYLSDYRNPSKPRMQGLQDAIWVESRTTLLNPRYLKEYMKGGASSAETFAETFRNTFAWNVMKPSVIESRLWEELYKTYVIDKQKLGLHEFFESRNPYALEEMTAVMLETVRKGLWKATPDQVKHLAELHVGLVNKNDAGCSGFVCDNAKLRSYIASRVSGKDAKIYQEKIREVLTVSKLESSNRQILKKEDMKNKVQMNKINPIVRIPGYIWWVAGLIFLAGLLFWFRFANKEV